METLYIWMYTIDRKPKGVPQNDDMWISENYKLNEEPEGLHYSWMLYNPKKHGFPPPADDLKFPDELYLIIQKQNELLFDLLSYHRNIMLVSERFLDYLNEKGLRDHFEVSKLNVVHKNGLAIKLKGNYFAIRIGKYDDDLFDFPAEGKKRAAGLQGFFLYPELNLKNEEISREIFIISEFCYSEYFIFTESVKNEIKAKFYAPEIYLIEEYPYIFNNRLHGNKLPPPQ